MRSITKALAALALFAGSLAASAQTFGSTNTYSGIAWDFFTTQPGFASCDTLFLDATGDVSHSSSYIVYGDLSCSGGSYFVNGNAYFDGSGGFNMQLDLGLAHKLQCISLPNLSGTCTIYNNSGSSTGSAIVEFL